MLKPQKRQAANGLSFLMPASVQIFAVQENVLYNQKETSFRLDSVFRC